MARDAESTPAEWEFYPCRVDDEAASILIDLAWARRPHPPNHDTLYASCIEMVDPDEHGMGSATEAEALYAAEDAILPACQSLGMS